MKKGLLLIFCAILIVSVASAQEVSEKKEIAVFSLSYSDWSIPSGALGMVDQQIISVFANLGRFDVRGQEFRLDADDVTGFIDMVKEINETNMAVDEKYRLGEATFTEADFQKIVASFIIVIPSMTYYESRYSESGWQVELQTAFSFVKVQDSTTIAQFAIDTYGSGDSQQDATLEAAEAISTQLDFEIRSIDEFKLKSGIIEVVGGKKVIIELGSGMGLKAGDEFSLIGSTSLSSGRVIQTNTGLLVISDVKEQVSYGRVIYNDGPVKAGIQLTEIPRTGIDTSVYGRMFIDSTGITGGSAGLRTVFSRGFYDLRPLAGVEVPIVPDAFNTSLTGLPASFYGGGELLWYFGRLQLEPSIAAGVTGLVPLSDAQSFRLSHIGISTSLGINWMLTDSFRFHIDGGYGYWFGVVSSLSSFGGFFAGAGVTFKM